MLKLKLIQCYYCWEIGSHVKTECPKFRRKNLSYVRGVVVLDIDHQSVLTNHAVSIAMNPILLLLESVQFIK